MYSPSRWADPHSTLRQPSLDKQADKPQSSLLVLAWTTHPLVATNRDQAKESVIANPYLYPVIILLTQHKKWCIMFS